MAAISQELSAKLLPPCGHARTELRRFHDGRGTNFREVCLDCGKHVRSVSWRDIAQPWSVPLSSPEKAHCYRCGAYGPIELHHFAPRSAFKYPNQWPIIGLCSNCHACWHLKSGVGSDGFDRFDPITTDPKGRQLAKLELALRLIQQVNKPSATADATRQLEELRGQLFSLHHEEVA